MLKLLKIFTVRGTWSWFLLLIQMSVTSSSWPSNTETNSPVDTLCLRISLPYAQNNDLENSMKMIPNTHCMPVNESWIIIDKISCFLIVVHLLGNGFTSHYEIRNLRITIITNNFLHDNLQVQKQNIPQCSFEHTLLTNRNSTSNANTISEKYQTYFESLLNVILDTDFPPTVRTFPISNNFFSLLCTIASSPRASEPARFRKR